MMGTDLKSSILQMAVQGKLVPQDPNDEPASALLERIREQRRRLIAEGKIKAPKGGESHIYRGSDGKHYEKRIDAKSRESESVCIEDEIPFEIPESWEWVRLSSLSSMIHYGFTSSSCESGSIKLLRITDIQDGRVNWDEVPYCSKNPKELKSYRLNVNDILIARTGGTIGKSFCVLDDPPVSVFASYLIRVVLMDPIICSYLGLFLDAPCYWKQLTEKSAGTGQPNVNGQSLANLLVPLPPLAEQSRIDQKYDAIRFSLSQYDALETAREKLDAELPDRLRKSILQMAVQGKLVPQDPNDEPAAVLLERIRDQRRRLIAEGEIKAPRGGESIIYRGSDGGYYEKRIDAKGCESDPVCIDDEIPFEIPESWEWARLGSLCNYGQCTNIEYTNIDDGAWVLELEQIEKDTGRIIEKTRKHGGTGSTKHAFKRGFVLYSKLRPYLNKVVIADEDGASTSEIFPLDFLELIDAHYAQLVLMSPYFIDYADFCSYGIKMPRLGTIDGQNALFPVPPKKEQGRISNFANTSLRYTTNR